MDFSIIITRPVEDILIGDSLLEGGVRMPYLSGPELCNLSSQFGCPKTYNRRGGNLSRWQYMDELLVFLNKKDRVDELLDYLFRIERFSDLKTLGTYEVIEQTHKHIIQIVVKSINFELLLSRNELKKINGRYVIESIGDTFKIATPKINVVSNQYIRDLPNRIKENIENKDYDSVITKSRTLLEEVLIYIIEQLNGKPYKSNGKLPDIYKDATALLNMRQNGEWDNRVNGLLGGLNKIMDAISGMRNISSDSHGVGCSRIDIKEREAQLTAQSSMLLAEYMLSVYNEKKK